MKSITILVFLFLVFFNYSYCQEFIFIDVDSALLEIKKDENSVYYSDSYLQDFITLSPELRDTILFFKPDFLSAFINNDSLPIVETILNTWRYEIDNNGSFIKDILYKRDFLNKLLCMKEEVQYSIDNTVYIKGGNKIYFTIRQWPWAEGYRISMMEGSFLIEKLWEERD